MAESKNTAPAEPWRRTPGVTALRSLIATGVVAVAGVAAMLADLYLFDGGADGWEDLQAFVGSIFMIAAGLGYGLLLFWWLDHLVAPRGRSAALGIHVAVAAVIAAVVAIVTGGATEVLTIGIAVLATAVGVTLAVLLAGRVRGSFAPRP